MSDPERSAKKMSASVSKSKWWVGAVVSPFLFLAVGILVALAAPKNENDWTGASLFAPIYFGLLGGCVLSFIFTAVSFAKKESGLFYAMLIGLPSLGWTIYSGVESLNARSNYRKAAADRIVSVQHEKEKMALIDQWTEKFRSTPHLISNDDFWSQQKDVDQVANLGLRRLFHDPAFTFPEDVLEYVLIHFSEDFYTWRDSKHVTKSDYESIIRNPKTGPALKEVARRAINDGNYSKSRWEK